MCRGRIGAEAFFQTLTLAEPLHQIPYSCPDTASVGEGPHGVRQELDVRWGVESAARPVEGARVVVFVNGHLLSFTLGEYAVPCVLEAAVTSYPPPPA